MKWQTWAICILVLAACVWLLLLNRVQRQPETHPQQQEAFASRPVQPGEMPPSGQQGSVANRQLPNTGARVSPSVPPATPSSPATSNPFFERVLPAWQKPIDFYGKVVDENSNAVAGASITFAWSETPAEKDEQTAMTSSDAGGFFSLHGKHGPSLEVWVNKPGYYAPHGGQWGFSYLHGDFSPDAGSPVVFRLRKKGRGEFLKQSEFPPGMGQIAQLRGDGTPVEIDLINGQKVPDGNGQLRLEFWRAQPEKGDSRFDWKCQLSVPGGGLIETDQEFAFEAPQAGYQPSVTVDVPATSQNWGDGFTGKYFVQLPGGGYGRIDFRLLAHNGVFTVRSAINPSGSRNLESAN